MALLVGVALHTASVPAQTFDPHSPDLSASGMVDPLDLFLLAEHWDETTGPAAGIVGDFDGSGRCGPEDLLSFLDLWGARIPVITSQTLVIEDEPSLDLIAFTTGEVILDHMGGGDPGIEVGDVVVSAASGGILQRVEGMDIVGDQVVLSTTQAALTDVVENGYLYSTLLFPPDATKGISLSMGEQAPKGTQPITIPLSNVELVVGNAVSARITEGSLRFTPSAVLETSIRNRRVEKFRFEVSGELDVDLSCRIQANVISGTFGPKVTLYKQSFLFTQVIGYVPVVELVTLKVVAGLELTTGAVVNVETGVDAEYSVGLGAEYRRDRSPQWRSITGGDRSITYETPVWSVEGYVIGRLYIEPSVEVKMYGVVGPRLGITPYLQLGSDSIAEPDCMWSLTAGVDARLDFNVTVLEHVLVRYAPPPFHLIGPLDLATGECNQEPTSLAMATIPPGSFLMGNTGAARDQYCWCSNCDCEEPRHTVTIDYSFQIGKYEVTNAQYADVLNWAKGRGYLRNSSGQTYNGGDVYHNGQFLFDANWEYADISYNGSQFVSKTRNSESMANHPAKSMTWYGSVAFCNWLSEKEGRAPAYNLSNWSLTNRQGGGYRLPSESEWEYVCRGPSSNPNRYAPFSFRDDTNLNLYSCTFSSILDDYMVWCGNNDGWSEEVGSKLAPHIWDVYDMHGNVWEWCQDWWHDSYNGTGRPDDGRPWESPVSSYRVIRGGNWDGYAGYCRSATRDYLNPGGPYYYIGFRLVRLP